MNNLVTLFSLLCIPAAMQACPTCYSALTEQSPPFFSQEAYKPFTTASNETVQQQAEKSDVTKKIRDVAHEEQNSISAVQPQ